MKKSQRSFSIFCLLAFCIIISAFSSANFPTRAASSNISFTKLWSRDVGNDYGQFIPAMADLNGDDVSEIISLEKPYYCTLTAIYGNNGSTMWKTNTTAIRLGSPIIIDIENDGTLEIIVPTQNFSVEALDVFNGKTGQFLWRITNDSQFNIKPCVSDLNGDGNPEIVFASKNNIGQILAYDLVAKNTLWNTQNSTFFGSTNIVSLNFDMEPTRNLVVVGHQKSIDAYYAINGSLKWKYDSETIVSGDIIIGDFDLDKLVELIFGDDSGSIYCISTSTGTIKWWYYCDFADRYMFPLYSSDIDFDGTYEILVSLEGSGYAVVNAKSGEEKLRIKEETIRCLSITLGDINNDDIIDIFTGLDLNNKAYFKKPDGSSNFIMDLSSEYSGGSLNILSVVYCDVTGDGNLEIIIQAQKLLCFTTQTPKWKISGIACHSFGGPIHQGEYKDSDSDGLNNQLESWIGTNMLSNDTDGDGISDLKENQFLFNPFRDDANEDADGDGISNIDELKSGTSPRLKDTDGDGIPDNLDFAPLDTLFPNLYFFVGGSILIIIIIVIIKKRR